MIATAFDHDDSRAGDPHLHTHVVISNKVQTVLDGRWRSLDGAADARRRGRSLRAARGVFADHLARMLGVEWEARDMGRDRNRAWAITGVPEALVQGVLHPCPGYPCADRSPHRSLRRTHGRRPSSATITKLRAHAPPTRPEKEVRSLADLTASCGTWPVLGSDATSWARGVTANEEPLLLRADDVLLDVIDSLGRDVVAAVGEKRPTSFPDLTAEAARQTMGYRFASTEDREAIVGLVVDAAEAASLRLTPAGARIQPGRIPSAGRHERVPSEALRAVLFRGAAGCSKTASSSAPAPPPPQPCR